MATREVERPRVSPLTDPKTAERLIKFAGRIVDSIALGEDKRIFEGHSDARNYFTSCFTPNRKTDKIDAFFKKEIEFAQSLRLTPSDRERVGRFFDQVCLDESIGGLETMMMSRTDMQKEDINALRKELKTFVEKNRDRVAIAMLKGGLRGGMNPLTRDVIPGMIRYPRGKKVGKRRCRLKLGNVNNLGTEDVLRRWGNAPGFQRSFDDMTDGATDEGQRFIEESRKEIFEMTDEQYTTWRKILDDNSEKWEFNKKGIDTLDDALDYLRGETQHLLMIFNEPLGDSAQDAFKEMVGATNPLRADDGTIRKNLVSEMDLDKRTRYPFIRNVIHTPMGGPELELELKTLSDDDVRIFVRYIRKLKEHDTRLR